MKTIIILTSILMTGCVTAGGSPCDVEIGKVMETLGKPTSVSSTTVGDAHLINLHYIGVSYGFGYLEGDTFCAASRVYTEEVVDETSHEVWI